jgi:hypothetical protein
MKSLEAQQLDDDCLDFLQILGEKITQVESLP